MFLKSGVKGGNGKRRNLCALWRHHDFKVLIEV
jgi:hypothetical protein